MANLESRNKQPKVAVVGIGNILLMDDGIGIHVAQALQALGSPDDIDLEVIDGGTSPDVFLSFQRVDKLIIIDAATMHGEPGMIYRFHPQDLTGETEGMTSVHQMGLPQSLKMMEYLGFKPKEIVIFGIEPKEMNWGLEPSDELKQKIPEIVRSILDEARKGEY